MASVGTPIRVFDEIAEFVASVPDRDAILAFRPSAEAKQRARELLARLKDETLTDGEQEELDDFVRAESFMRLVKARLRQRARRAGGVDQGTDTAASPPAEGF